MAENLRKETVKGVAWSALERISTGGVLFIANLILARLLSPKDFGLLAVISIFVQIAQTFIDSGFSNALIQKKDRNQIDYSTVFYFNLVISCIFYIILYFGSPFIAKFFDNSQLINLTRVVGLNLLIGALVSVHKTRLTVNLQFKEQGLITLLSSVVAAIIAILLAYHGFGVWSLVVLTLVNISLQTILFYTFVHWHPSLAFSTNAFKGLFSYSSKLLGASLIHLLYRNIYPIVIGKRFSATDLGFFNRADTFAMYAPQLIGHVVSRVAFPIFSRLQDDNDRLRKAYSKYIIYASIIIFPIMIGLMTLAKPLTLLILKEKWLPMVPMLQILCIDWMTDHLCMINLNVLYVKGRSDLALKLEVIKKLLAVSIFIVSIYWGIIGVCWGRVMYGVIAVYINSFYTKKLIGLSLGRQLKDILLPLCISILMGICVYSSDFFIHIDVYQVIAGILIGSFSYVILMFFLMKNHCKELIMLIKGLVRK